jgi:hypothetical protein
MNAYLDNLFHMDSSTGTSYVSSNRRNVYKEIAMIAIFVGTFQTALEVSI